MSFFDLLDPESRAALLAVASRVSYRAGATLARHGEPARGAYVLGTGSAEAVVTLPGGESFAIGRLEPGGIFGEMALVETGTCMATVRATSPIEGWFITSEDFRALAAQRHPPAIRIQHALTLALGEKLEALNAQLLACAAPEDRPARDVATWRDPPPDVTKALETPFDVREFLPRLPFFERFSPAEIDELIAAALFLERPRGYPIFMADTAPDSAFIVVRGAAEVISLAGGRERRIAIVGPGQLLGHVGVLRERAHATCAFARESSVLLDLPASAFRDLYFGPSRAGALLRRAVQRSLLDALDRTNRSVSRLLAQGRLGASRAEGSRLETSLRERLAEVAPS